QYSVGEEMFIDGPPGTIGPDGKPTETVTEENYFFRLSEYQRPLIDLIESGELNIQPEVRKNEVLSFLRGNISNFIHEWIESYFAKGGPDNSFSRESLEKIAYDELPKSLAGHSYVHGALKDLSISRSSFKWGIPVPGDEKHVIYVWLDALANYMTAVGYGSDDPADQEKFKKYWPADLHLVGKEIIRFHCVYWPAFLLALNPATAGKKPEEVSMEVHKEWAKEMLPKAITAHGWLLFEESKMSKSRGNIVRTETILDAFGTLLTNPAQAGRPTEASRPSDLAHPDEASRPVKGTASAVPQNAPATGAALAAEVTSSSPQPEPPSKAEQDLFAADVIRYFLLREIPFGQDGSFSFDALVQRYNSDLANGYGNLVSRTLKMISQYFDGIVSPHLNEVSYNNYTAAENAAIFAAIAFSVEKLANIQRSIDSLNFANTLTSVQALIKWTDDILSEAKPWKERDTSEDTKYIRTQVLFQAAESIRIITALLYPILPHATSKVWAQLGLDNIEEAARKGELKDLKWGGLKPGTKLGPLSPIFPRAPKELIQTMTDMELNHAAPKPAEPAGLPHVNLEVDNPAHNHTEFRESPISSESATPALNLIAETTHPIAATGIPDTPQIAIDDFVKIDLRVARILVAERIPKADKLLRLEVDLGYETRQILSGIAQWYTPEELIGRNIVVIANLAPRKMRGLESHGMLLAASHGEDGKPVLATFGEEIALGSRLK
ncbi:MAG: methionine--tRNA ligase subunit beta, partial [Edaphobacter sp.]